MPVTEMIVGISAGLFLLLGFVFFLRLLQAWQLHSTLRKAIERDSNAAPALIERIGALDTKHTSLGNDDRNGMVLIALGLALVGFAMIGLGNRPDEMRVVASAALFPLFVGIALLVRRRLLKRELAAEAEAEHGA